MSIRQIVHGNRWFVLGVLFFVLNGYAVYLLCEKPPLVQDVKATMLSPSDGRVSSGSRTTLRWRFSANMVSGFGIGKWFDAGPVTFSPGVEGSFCWLQANELVFRPANGWRGCTEFTATLSEDLRGLDARPLTGPRAFKFRSDPLSLRGVSQISFSDGRKARLGLEFSDSVSSSQLESHLKIRTPAGRDIAYEICNAPTNGDPENFLQWRRSVIALLKTRKLQIAGLVWRRTHRCQIGIRSHQSKQHEQADEQVNNSPTLIGPRFEVRR